MSLINVTLPYNNSAGGEAAVGSVLFVGTQGSPTIFLPLGNCGNMKWGMKVKTADVTNQGTNWTRSIPTLFEGGTFTCDIHFIPSAANTASIEGHSFTSGIGSLFTQAAILPWKLVFPDGTTEFFTGYMTDFPMDMNLDKDLMVALTITVIGQPVLA
jgi:hypothetical protein